MATSHLHSARRNRKPYRSRLGILALLCGTASLLAQSPAPPVVQPPAQPPTPSIPVAPVPSPPRFVVVLDAAHGGDDLGGKLIDGQDEKSVDLAFSVRLRSLLAARGMQVVTTREQDRTLSPIERAETANRANAQACISLHAAESGYGMHIFTSSLTPAQSAAHFAAWKTSQSVAVSRSLALAGAGCHARRIARRPYRGTHALPAPRDVPHRPNGRTGLPPEVQECELWIACLAFLLAANASLWLSIGRPIRIRIGEC